MPLGSDIETPALAKLTEIFTDALVTPGILKTLKIWPLQDDPTLVAPYLIFAPDPVKSIQPDNRDEKDFIEIGGPIHFLHHFHAQCGTPSQKTREAAFSAINNLVTKVARIIMNNFALDGITSEDQQLRIEGANPYQIPLIEWKIFGGNNEFFGKATFSWYYPVSWYGIY